MTTMRTSTPASPLGLFRPHELSTPWLLADLFDEVWCCDFEFRAPDGEVPEVRCMVAQEYKTRRMLKLWADELESGCPFDTAKRNLFVAYYASAEIGCFLELGWDLPAKILDLYVEFKRETNNRRPAAGYGLLSCLTYYGLTPMGSDRKNEMRELAIRPGSSEDYTPQERALLLDYCAEDVLALTDLLDRMAPRLDFPRSLLRGRYMAAVAAMEREGVPIDLDTLARLQRHWDAIKDELVAKVNEQYGVFEDGHFRAKLFTEWLVRNEIPWPMLPGDDGLALDDDTFRQMARCYPAVAPLRELRHALGEMRLFDRLAVGRDGRNRCLLSPFAARTGRNQPSNAKFIFGPSAWLRGLIKPVEGRAVAYIDWAQQEFGIAAYLSRDKRMIEAYNASDPYLAFAKMANAVPEDATKQTHPVERDRFKICALAVLFGQSEFGLAYRLGIQVCEARMLLTFHKEAFPGYWLWCEAAMNHAMFFGWIDTVFGWTLNVSIREAQNPRSLANFPVQGNAAEMMRVAACLLTEVGLNVCCPVHDAFLIEASAGRIDQDVASAQVLMRQASGIVLGGGHTIESDAKIVRYPDRYMDARGQTMWNTVMTLIDGRD